MAHPRRPTTIRHGVSALVAVAAVVVGACGGSGDDRSPREIVLAASSATASRQTSRVDITIETNGLTGEAAQSVPRVVRGDGAWDYDRGVGRLRMEIPISQQGGPREIETVVAEDAIYQKFPPELASFLGGKVWLKIGTSDLDRLAGANLGEFATSMSSDPTRSLVLLRGASDDVTEVGKEELRGVDVVHYRMTVDVEKAAEAAGDARRVSGLGDRLGTGTVPMEVWVDGDDQLRKLVQEMPGPEGSVVEVTIELYDFGIEVDAAAPPADQVSDVSQLLSSVGNLTKLGGAPTTTATNGR